MAPPDEWLAANHVFHKERDPKAAAFQAIERASSPGNERPSAAPKAEDLPVPDELRRREDELITLAVESGVTFALGATSNAAKALPIAGGKK